MQIYRNANDWKGLGEHVLLLSKRRGQLKQAVQAMVRQSMGYLDSITDTTTHIELIKTLLTLTEGKIYVEIERARLTRRLARMKEAEGNIQEAAEILQEVAVETFGAMAKTEKIAYILEQVRLCLDRKDFVRAQILARKVSPRAFVVRESAKKGELTGEIGIEGTAIEEAEPGTPTLEELKLQYYALMIKYYAHEHNYLEMCRSYRSVLDTSSVKDDAVRRVEVLKKVCWYVVLAPVDSHQRTLMEATKAESSLDDLPEYKDLLDRFSAKEVLWWRKLSTDYAAEIEAQSDVFGGELGQKRKDDLKLRVIEHNILIISGYYKRITTERLAQMLDLDKAEAEQRLCDLVTGQGLVAKVDRPAGIVQFGAKSGPAGALNTWSNNIAKLLDLVEKTCQQIQKESMVRKVPLRGSA